MAPQPGSQRIRGTKFFSPGFSITGFRVEGRELRAEAQDPQIHNPSSPWPGNKLPPHASSPGRTLYSGARETRPAFPSIHQLPVPLRKPRQPSLRRRHIPKGTCTPHHLRELFLVRAPPKKVSITKAGLISDAIRLTSATEAIRTVDKTNCSAFQGDLSVERSGRAFMEP
jgi:hypothetical protein